MDQNSLDDQAATPGRNASGRKSKVSTVLGSLSLVFILLMAFTNPVPWGNPFPARFHIDGLEWAKVWRGWGEISIEDVAVADNGYLYVTGHTTRIADFDPGWGFQFHRASGSKQKDYMIPAFGFLAKMHSDGKLMWVADAPGINDTLAIDPEGFIYLTGKFSEDTDFDPGPEEDIREPSHSGCACAGDSFLTKYSPDGRFVWARTWKGVESLACGDYVVVDSIGCAYAAGQYEGLADFDTVNGPTTRSATGRTDLILCKFDSDGNLLWVRAWGGYGDECCHGMVIDRLDNICLAGKFATRGMDFNPDPAIVTSPDCDAARAAYLTKFDSDGNHLWVVASADWWPTGLGVDGQDRILVAGSVEGVADLDPGEGVDEIRTTDDSQDACIVAFTPDGEYLWGLTWGEEKEDFASDMLADTEGRLYVTGSIDEPESLGVFRIPLGHSFLSRIDGNHRIQWTRRCEQRGCGNGLVHGEDQEMYLFGAYGLHGSFLAKFPMSNP